MPRDSNGNTSPLPGTLVNSGDTILPSQHNPMVSDVYAMMTQSLSRDGQGGMRAPLNMNGYQIQNVGTATGPDGVATVAMVDEAKTQTTTVNTRLTSFITAVTTWANKAIHVGKISWYNGVPATIDNGEILASGGTFSRTTYPELWAWIQQQSPVTDAVWLSGTVNRAKYSTGDGSTTFRVPDLNGTQSGSLRGLYLRGSGGGTVQNTHGDAIRNITGRFRVKRSDTGAEGVFDETGPFSISNSANRGTFDGQSTEQPSQTVTFNASDVVPTSSENRPVSAIGIYTIRAIPFKFTEPT